MSSRTQADRAGDDACSPNQGTNAFQLQAMVMVVFSPHKSLWVLQIVLSLLLTT